MPDLRLYRALPAVIIGLAEDDVAVVDAGVKIKDWQAAGLERYGVRLPTNFTARRNGVVPHAVVRRCTAHWCVPCPVNIRAKRSPPPPFRPLDHLQQYRTLLFRRAFCEAVPDLGNYLERRIKIGNVVGLFANVQISAFAVVKTAVRYLMTVNFEQ
ncbi:MAG: hypothetical protein ACYDBJ_04130 [Aggregatilineales bacterium]